MIKIDNWVSLKDKMIAFLEQTNCVGFGRLEALNKVSDESELLDYLTSNIFWFVRNDEQPFIVLVEDIPDGHYKNKNKEFTIVDGKLHGEYIEFEINDKGEQVVIAREPIVNGFTHGTLTTYNKQTGKLRSEVNFVNGLRHGKYVVYDLFSHSKDDVRYYYKGIQVSEEFMLKAKQEINEIKTHLEKRYNISLEKDVKLKEMLDNLSF